MLRQALIASILGALSLAGCHAATAVQCPTPQLRSSRGDLKESAADIRSYQNRFVSGFSDNGISEAIASLRNKYPGASKAGIANYLVAADCPNAIEQAVGPSDQKARLASFERAVHAKLRD